MDDLLPFDTWPDAAPPARRLLPELSDTDFAVVVDIVAHALTDAEAFLVYGRRTDTC